MNKKMCCALSTIDNEGTHLEYKCLYFAVIPPFHTAVDQAITYLDPVRGLVGVTDFYVSAKFDLPLRQMSWTRRFFWRCADGSTNLPWSSGATAVHTRRC